MEKMDDILRIADGFAHIVRMILARPDKLTIDVVGQPGGYLFRLSVSPDEIGKLIGKGGRIARSLRIILMAIGKASKRNILLDITSPAEAIAIRTHDTYCASETATEILLRDPAHNPAARIARDRILG